MVIWILQADVYKRQVLSYVASICGGNAVITRDGKFTIKSLSEIKKSIDGNNYFDYKRAEVKYKIGKISCQIAVSYTHLKFTNKE